MDDLDIRVQRAVTRLQAELDNRPIPEPPMSTRVEWPRRLMAFAGIVAATAVIVLLTNPPMPSAPNQAGSETLPPVTPTTQSSVTTTTSGPSTTLQVSIPAEGPLFGEETGVVLLFDDGYHGLIAVNPDLRLARSNAVPGQRPGDEPFSMVRVGAHLVVGWGEPFAVRIATFEGLSLGKGLIFLPGPDDDRVWLVDEPWGPGGRAWQVGLDGQQLTEPAEVENPQLGIPGGLVLGDGEEALTLWDADTRETRELADSEGGWARYVTSEELGWCFDPCLELFVTELETLETRRFPVPDGYTALETGALSVVPAPSGSGHEGSVAALVSSRERQGLWLLEPATGNETLFELKGAASHLAWSPDGTQLFASGRSYGSDITQLWRYAFASDTLTEIAIPIGGALSMVVIESDYRDVYFRGPECIDKPINRVAGCRGEF